MILSLTLMGEEALHRVVTSGFENIYLAIQLGKDNKLGLFHGYKGVCKKIADIIHRNEQGRELRVYKANYL